MRLTRDSGAALVRTMLILLVVLWLLGVLARDEPRKESNYVIKRMSSCPDVGYFFRREPSPNALDNNLCYLCFCQNDGTAVCWQRENKRCDAAHYQHGVGKRDTRIRRSPIGLSDIFFRDAARDLFNKQMPETCKPYDTSFSEGCPPADWCTGCTVCDCDANGRWDCHILSFCPDKKDKNKIKKSKKRLRNGTPTRSTPGIAKRTTNKKPPKRTPAPKQTTVNTNKQIKHNVKNVSQVKQSNKSTKQIKIMKPKGTRNVQKSNNASPKPLIKNKYAKSKNLTTDNIPKLSQFNLNDTDKITQEVFKKVVSAMQTFLDKRISAIQSKPTVKSVEKRTVVKRSTKDTKNTNNAKKKVNGKFKSITNKKKYIKAVGPKNNNKKNINNAKNLVKGNKKGVTTKKTIIPVKTNGKRIKRDVSNYNITETVVLENSSYRNIEIPVTVLPNSTIIEDETKSNATETNNYYKYSMITPTFSIATDNPEEYQIVYALGKNKTINYNTTHAHHKRDKENIFDEIQAIVLNSSIAEIKNDSILGKLPIPDQKAKPDFNDLKFNNWPQVKLLKISLLSKKLANANSTKSVSTSNRYNRTDVNEELTIKKHLKAKDVERIVSSPSRKYNRSKIINTLSCNTIHTSKRNLGNYGERIYHKIDDLQNVLKKALGEFSKNNTTKIKQKRKRFNVIKYLKTFFSKVFKRYRSKEKNAINDQIELNSHIIDSICDSFNNCDMSQKNNINLRTKIAELNSESRKILRTIKIIKGLLHLLDVPTNPKFINDQKFKPNMGKSNLKDDISKLNAVLKDKYTYNNTTLTSTQMTQIRYIKNNTQSFVQSVSKFASILNEIITIFTKKDSIKDKSKLAFKTVKRSYENNRTSKNFTAGDFKRLKGLLIKYNMIQNTFVRKIYHLLSKFEKLHENDMNTKVSNENKVRRATIELFSRNIINNLRKLKNLAKTLSSRRQKRDAVRDDDSMEYLLTLMEYLLKQNYPLDATPVNDGIDLLIEAIKSAPDIKPIKKKVLQSMPVNIRISRTTEPVPSSVLKDDSSSDSRRASEDSASNDTRLETGEQSSYQEMEKEDNFKYSPGKNIFETNEAVKTDINYDKEKLVINSNIIDSTVIPGAFGIFGNIQETTEHNNFKKFDTIVKESIKKFEVFNSDVEDEDVEITNSTTATDSEAETDYSVTVTIPLKTTDYKLTDVKTTPYNMNSVDVSGNSDGEKRVGLDWLDEGYEDSKEVKQIKTSRKTQTAAPVITTIKSVHVENVSSITKEVRDEEEKKRRAKINVEDVMFKKQMDLLNSLDYGTERSDAEDTESKEGEERYSGDTFPAYFS